MVGILSRQDVIINVAPVYLCLITQSLDDNRENIFEGMAENNLTPIDKGKAEINHCIDEMFLVSRRELYNFKHPQTYNTNAYRRRDITLNLNPVFFAILIGVIYINKDDFIESIQITTKKGNDKEELANCLDELRNVSVESSIMMVEQLDLDKYKEIN
jgi:hypothetical protein